ncbi:MAG TPA: hypothetical protein VG672_14005 [Bryobacteraceae bacterium]|nr:hypothetical protein [Bryobacteraceae bacterium]
MGFVTSRAPSTAGVTRPIVQALFVASCLLSVVSWYTTWRGMALYLSAWFSVLASLGVQSALVCVAWLIGFTRARRALLVTVYVITAAVSIAFSYVSLYTWFSSRERPMQVERKLYDTLNAAIDQAEQNVAAAIDEGQKHVLALNEMTQAEKAHGYISRAQDADPFLARIRESVAREAQTYSTNYQEGAGTGVRYTAFDRYAKLTQQSVERMQEAQRRLSDVRSRLKPLEPTDQQLREFRQAYDSIPWSDVEQSLHAARFERPAVPNYADFVDRSASGQEDLLIAFQELLTAPTSRHLFSLMLAAFIDIIVFLLAFASGPHFFGSAEQRWFAAGAAMEALDDQVFVRDFLRKLSPGLRGMARVDASLLTPGEQQVCLLLVGKGSAVVREEEGRTWYLLNPEVHEQLMESLASQGFRLKAAAPDSVMS